MPSFYKNKIHLLIIAVICFGVLFFSSENVHAAGGGCSTSGPTVTLNSGTYSANVGSTFNVTVTLTGFSGTCTDSVQDYTTSSWATVPNTDLTDIDCNGVACTASSITNFTKTLKCEAAGTYSIRGTGYGAQVVSSASTATCNDVTAPTVSTLSPADNATSVTTTANLILTFSEAVDVESGNIVIKKASDNSTFETIDVTSGNVTGSGTASITINPTGIFAENTGYYVQIDATAFDDVAGNSYAGIADTTTWNFTTGDFTAPATTDNVDTSWHNSNVTITLTCSDTGGSGCSQTYYTTDGTTPTVSSSAGTSVVLSSDGTYTIKYFSVDIAGNQEAVKTATNTVKLDKTAPSGESITYTDGYYTTASVALTVNDGTDSGSDINTTTRTIQRKSATLSAGTCASFGSFSTISPTGAYPDFTDATVSSDNCYQYQYSVSDNAGNQATSTSSNTAKVDTTVPSAPGTPDMTAGTDTGSSNTDNITSNTAPSFTISCETGDTVTLYDNTTSVGAGTCVASTVTIASSALSGGIHSTMNTKQTDPAWNPSVASGNLSITIDTTNPTSSITTPSDNSFASSTTVALTGTSADTNLSQTQISVDGGGYVAAGGTAGSWTYSATSLSQGAHTFRTQATDSAGNTGLSAVVNVTVDTIAPAITVTTFPTINVSNQSSVGLAGACEGSLAISLSLADTHSHTVTASPAPTCSSGAWSKSLDLSSLNDGDTITATASQTDTAGNIGTGTKTAVKDTVAPTISIGAPSASLTKSGPITYTITYGGADAVTLANGNITLNKTSTADGSVAVSGSGTTTRTVTISSITGDGTLGISIGAATASDTAGNTSLSAGPSATFTVDNTAPVVSITAPSDGAYKNAAFDITYTPESGSDTCAYSTNGGTSYGTPVTCSGTFSSIAPGGDADYSVKIKEIDIAGNVGYSSTITVHYDTTLPIITIANPTTAPAQSKTITASTDSGILTMSNTTGSTCNGTLTFVTYASQTFTSESDNTKKVCYKAVDSAVNTTYSMSDAIAGIDVTNPTSSISSPSDNSSASSTTVALTGTSADTNLFKTEISVDGGGYVATGGTTASWTYSATGLSQGAHTFRTQATDSAGNTGTSTLIHVTVDTIAPVVGNTTLSGFVTYSTYIKGTGTIVGGTATDTGGSGVAGGTCEYTTDNGTSWNTGTWLTDHCQQTSVAISNGTSYTFNTRVKDAVANQGTGTVTSTYVGDTASPTSPSVAITDTNGYTQSNTPVLTLSAVDSGSGLKEMAFSCNNSSWGSWVTYGTSYSSFNIETGAGCTAGNGAKTIYVKFRDNLDNESSSANDSTTFDTTDPTSAISSPADSSFSSSTTVSLTGTSADTNLFKTEVSVDGGGYVATGGTAGSWTYSATGLSQGAHTFRTQATDSAGNTGLSAVVNAAVDTTAPTVSDNTPSTWQVNDFAVTLTCDDTTGGNSGCAKVYYTIDSTTPDTGSSFVNSGSGSGWQFTQATEGDYVLKYRGLDAVGNIEDTVTAGNHLRLDKIAPTVSDDVPSGWQNSDIVVTLTCDDTTGGNSGCSKVFYTLDGTDPDANSPLFVNSASSWQFTYSTSTKDTAVLKYRGLDTAGNLGDVATALNSLEIDKITPVISNIAPVSGSDITATGQIITFTLNKTGDCRLATSTKSYDGMAGGTSCSVNNGIQISCVAPDLGGAGSKDLYFACEDYLGNKDTAGSATHVTYVVPAPASSAQTTSSHTSSGGGQTRLVLPIVSTGAPAGPFNVSINNGAGVTNNRNVTLKLSSGAGATAVIISNNPDFSGAIIIPYQNSFEYDLCGGSVNCLDQNYTVYAKFLSSSGTDSPAVSSTINLRTSSFIGQVGDTASQFVGEISKVVQIFQPKKEVTTNFPPINISVPKDAQTAFQRGWNLMPASMQDFVFASLPRDLQDVVLKFPEVADTLNKVGITRMNDVGQLEVAKISLPGLAESAGISSIQGVSIPVADFSSAQAGEVPTSVVFARAGENNLDLNVKLSIDNQGAVAQTLNTVQGRPLTLAIKPDLPASGIKGYLIFKSNRVGMSTTTGKSGSLTASVVDALEMNASVDVGSVDTPDLVLSQFDYKDSGNGIWTANVASPLVLGQYELRTVVTYKKKTENPKTISMIVVVDPEGYVYRKLGDGSEARITGASVSIYWLNSKTNQYELWPAKDFRQDNPQTTDVTGRYSFLVPPGSYYLKAIASSYSDYKSDVFKVEENKGVFMNIELKAKFSWRSLFNLQTILLGGIFIVLAYLAVIFTLRRKSRI